MKLVTDYNPREAFLRVWSDSEWAGHVKERKSQSSLKIEVDGCPFCSASRKQKTRANPSGEAEFYAAASATCEAMLAREICCFWTASSNRALAGQCGSTRDMPISRRWDRPTRVNGSSLGTAVGEARSGRDWSMHIHREPRRLGRDEVTTRPQTATVEAMERLMSRKRMDKARKISGELQCKESLVLVKETEESCKHCGAS